MDLDYSVYEGSQPFIFISYAHKDSERVLPVIEALQNKSYRIWFDAGINAGSEFADYIAERLKNCSCFIAFISKNYVSSDFCNREIQYCLKKKRPLIPVYLEEAELPAGLEMQLSPIHALFFNRDMPKDRFLQELTESEKIRPCLGGDIPPVPAPRPEPEPEPRPEPEPGKKRRSPLPIILIALLVLAAGAVCVFANPFGHEDGSVYARLTATATPTPAPTPTPSPTPTPVPTPDTRYLSNVLMRNGFEDTEAEKDEVIFNTGVKRKEVGSITFLNSLASAPKNAADASEAQNGSVKAWAVKNDELFDLYIAADGGVSAPEDSQYLFSCLTSLESIEFGNAFHTGQTKNMLAMFWNCSSLKTLDLGDGFDTSGVTNMGFMFDDCSALTSLSLGSKFDASSVTEMSYMFSRCSALTFLSLGDKFDTSNVQNMDSMFRDCSSLQNLALNNKFNTSKVQKMYAMFWSCINLKTLTLGDGFDTSAVTDMGYMFGNCPAMTTLDLGSRFNTSAVQKMNYMFWNCSGIPEDAVCSFDFSRVDNYIDFMEDGAKLNGRPWQEYFG